MNWEDIAMLHVRFKPPQSLPNGQTGAVLIVVLLFLIMITVVGVIAVRNSSTNLKLATSDQINTVLIQAADSANSKIEQAINGAPDSETYLQIMSRTGIVGRYILDEDNRNDIVDFCYRPRSKFFNIDNAVVRRGTGKLVNNTTGYCDPENADDYTSSRQTTMTQVMIKNVSDIDGRRFSQYALGNDSMQKNATKLKFEVYSTAVLPAYGNSTTAQVKACFQKDASSTADSVSQCMTKYGIPSKTLVENIVVENFQRSEYCRLYGGKTVGSTSSLCPSS